jgi:hypothetical protein
LHPPTWAETPPAAVPKVPFSRSKTLCQAVYPFSAM